MDAAGGVDDEAGSRLASPEGHNKDDQGKARVNAVGEGAADDLFGTKIFHNGTIDPSLVCRDIGDVADPCDGLVKGEAARKEIGRDGSVSS